jgi:hypothetical protein
MPDRWMDEEEHEWAGRSRGEIPPFFWWMLVPYAVLLCLMVLCLVQRPPTREEMHPKAAPEVAAQAHEAAEQDFHREELQAMQAIADELRHLRAVLEAR